MSGSIEFHRWELDLDSMFANNPLLQVYVFHDLLPSKETRISTHEIKAMDILFFLGINKNQRFETFRTGN